MQVSELRDRVRGLYPYFYMVQYFHVSLRRIEDIKDYEKEGLCHFCEVPIEKLEDELKSPSLIVADYLRMLGIALPYMKYSVNELVELRIIYLRTCE